MSYKNKTITIETTNRCSASCTMCPRDKFSDRLSTMSVEMYTKIIEDANDVGITTIDLCGFGDVFLDNTIIEKLIMTKKINPEFNIYASTTGIAMREKYHSYINKYIDTLRFSIHGFTQETFEDVMRGLSYDKCMRNIHEFLKINENTYTIGSFVQLPENQKEVQDWISYWEPKLSQVCVWLPHNWTTGRKFRSIDKSKQKTCGRPVSGPLNVSANGDAHVCCFDYNKELKIGNMHVNSISDVLNSTKMREIQRRHEDNNFTGMLCEYCDQTIHDKDVLVYATNKCREVGKETSTLFNFNDNR